MSYVVLARKLRPSRFSSMIGQKTIGDMLSKAIVTNKIAHAFLFTGPRGTGKTSCARIVTKALNCENLQQGEPCNECLTCLAIQKGAVSDILEIDAASNRGIEHIRELRESVKYAPSMCRYKVYIIDEVHMLTTESFNALLKTLEEPPDHVVFILATTDLHKVPITVVSRCQRFDFSYIAVDDIASFLKQVAEQEKITITQNAIQIVAKQANGGMRDALTMLDMLLNYTEESIDEDIARQALGLYDLEKINAIFQAVIKQDAEQALTLFHQEIASGRSLTYFLTTLLQKVKNLRILSKLGRNSIVWSSFSNREQDLYKELLPLLTEVQLTRYFTILLQTEQQIKQTLHREACMEMALLDLCSLDNIVSAGEVIAFLQEASQQIEKQDRLSLSSMSEQAEQTKQVDIEKRESLVELQAKVESLTEELKQEEKAQEILKEVLAEEKVKQVEVKTIYKEEELKQENILAKATTEDLQSQWLSFLSFVDLSDETETNTILYNLLKNIEPISFENNILSMKGYNVRMFDEEKKKQLQDRASRFFERDIKIEYIQEQVIEANTAYQLEENKKQEEKKALIQETQNDTLIQNVKEVFPDSVMKEIKENVIKE